MLVAVSGSQGSGKSTILQELKSNGYNVIERKTSRSILTDWNVTLQEVNNDPELTKNFQREITKRKHQDEQHAVQSDQLWFTERTHSDLFTYTLIALGKDNIHSDWVDDYYNTCAYHNNEYSLVFYLTAGHFIIEHDGVRGSNQHYSRMVDVVMLDLTKQMVANDRLNIIDTGSLEERIDIILKQSTTQHQRIEQLKQHVSP